MKENYIAELPFSYSGGPLYQLMMTLLMKNALIPKKQFSNYKFTSKQMRSSLHVYALLFKRLIESCRHCIDIYDSD